MSAESSDSTGLRALVRGALSDPRWRDDVDGDWLEGRLLDALDAHPATETPGTTCFRDHVRFLEVMRIVGAADYPDDLAEAIHLAFTPAPIERAAR